MFYLKMAGGQLYRLGAGTTECQGWHRLSFKRAVRHLPMHQIENEKHDCIVKQVARDKMSEEGLQDLQKRPLFAPKTPWWTRRKPLRNLLKSAYNGALWLADRAALLGLTLRGLDTVRSWQNRHSILGDKFVVFATHPTSAPPACHKRLLSRFVANGYKIILASGHPDADRLLCEYYDPSWIRLVRRPFGRDFGSYRDASLTLLEYAADQAIDLRRIIFLNDSFVTFESSENLIVDHLCNENSDFSGLTENFEIGYHVGSFAVALSGRAFMNPAIAKFWRSYVPISTRLHSITAGEMELTASLREAGFNPHVLHDLASMKSFLSRMDLLELRAVCRKLPQKFDAVEVDLLKAVDHFLDEENEGGREAEMHREDLKDRVTHAILAFVFSASPVHLGCALLVHSKGAIIKKDVVWRLAVQPWELPELVDAADGKATADEKRSICKEIMSRGHPYTLGYWGRIAYNWSVI